MKILAPLHEIRSRAQHKLRDIEQTLSNGKDKNPDYIKWLTYYRGYWLGKISAITELLESENDFNETKYMYEGLT